MILEQLLAAIQANTQAVLANTQAQGGGQYSGALQSASPAAAQPILAAQPAIDPAAANATSDSLMALIQPHISNDAIKTDLGTAMRGMGINALPEVQPHQLPQLYAAFSQVIARHQAAAPVTSASII